MELTNQSIRTTYEFWFIPIDFLMIFSTSFVILISLISLIILLLTKTNRTTSMILLCNSYISELFFACIMLSMAIFSLKNDFKQIQYQDSLCIFRGYMSYALSSVRSHSYLLQSIYHYLKIKHPSKLCFHSIQLPIVVIVFIWMISLIHPFLFSHQIEYNVNNQVCHMSFEKSLFIFYTCFLSYLNPIIIIIVLYFKLVRYVQKMNKLMMPVNHLLRIKREFKMVRRIVMLIFVLITLVLPYTIFFIMSFFISPPRYHFRIAFLSVDLSLACVIVALSQFADPIRDLFLKRFINRSPIEQKYLAKSLSNR